MMNSWLYGLEPDLGGAENMRRDELMAEACAVDGRPRLRFYSWKPWALSLGFNQKDERINRAELERQGYGLVRRPTGGRAVFHAQEITYGVAMPSGDRGVHETYAKISEALKSGFELLGASGIEFSRSNPDFREHYQDIDSEGCFSASALNELTWNGRKLVGSAQRRYGSVLLQHGSILLGPAHLEITKFLGLPEERHERMREMLAKKTATLSDILSSSLPSFEEIVEALLSGFKEAFEIDVAYTDSRHLVESTVNSREIEV
ncbi:MAG: lipoate--protein ligase family protein [Chlorobi bacterium]|nr:lipoate--protein ligase family protein [Chlorobiota bacterium]